jgi:hypothetical protein
MVSAGSFYLIVPGVVCVLLALAEGSAQWAWLVIMCAYVGYVSGLASGDVVLAGVRTQAEAGVKMTQVSAARGMFIPRMLYQFWVPQVLFLFALSDVAKHLEPSSAPRSLKSTEILVMIESMSFYFCTISGAWYKAWRWGRTLPVA